MTEHFDLDIIKPGEPIYFIGIGGISMSALAVILKNDGYPVSGSDFRDGDMAQELRRQGITVHIGHEAKNVRGAALVVYTAAIHEDNPELVEARRLGIPAIERAVLVGALMKRYRNPIAVSGTHGKTTTTSMLSHVLLSAKCDPTILVGGVLPIIGGNMRDGGNDYLITEACEYCGSFLKFRPLYSIILNIEEDHLDYFKDIQDIIACFRSFAQLTPDNGAIVANGDDKNVKEALKGLDRRIVTFGIRNGAADYTAENISYDQSGCASFDVLAGKEVFLRAKLSVPGIHNVSNALAVTAMSALLGIPRESIAAGFDTFRGTNRRFEKKGECGGAVIIDDYAHHPTEIKATLAAARAAAHGHKVHCVFQPHTYTRALKLKEEFARSFADCDDLVITDIYAAREKDTGLIHSRDLAEAVNAVSGNAVYIQAFDDVAEYFRKKAQPGDLILTMGAGDVYRIGEMLAK